MTVKNWDWGCIYSLRIDGSCRNSACSLHFSCHTEQSMTAAVCHLSFIGSNFFILVLSCVWKVHFLYPSSGGGADVSLREPLHGKYVLSQTREKAKLPHSIVGWREDLGKVGLGESREVVIPGESPILAESVVTGGIVLKKWPVHLDCQGRGRFCHQPTRC
jgi:hypothetical protein